MIKIIVHLNSGIYRSEGGGEDRVVAEWATGPRNLIKAVHLAREIRASNERSYGNIGCGSTRIEIDGKIVDWYDERSVLTAAADRRECSHVASATEQARELCRDPHQFLLTEEEYEKDKYGCGIPDQQPCMITSWE